MAGAARTISQTFMAKTTTTIEGAGKTMEAIHHIVFSEVYPLLEDTTIALVRVDAGIDAAIESQAKSLKYTKQNELSHPERLYLIPFTDTETNVA